MEIFGVAILFIGIVCGVAKCSNDSIKLRNEASAKCYEQTKDKDCWNLK